MMRNIQILFDRNRKLIFWLTQFALWTFYFLYDLVVIHRYSYMHLKYDGFSPVLRAMLFCYFGIPLSLLLKIVLDFVVSRWRSVPLFFLAGVGVPFILGNIWYLFNLLLNNYFGRNGYANPTVDYLSDLFVASLILIAWGAIYLFVKFYQEWTKQKYQTEQALLLAENAQLKMLRYQLNPHFLFNSLSSLRATIREEPKKAVDMVTKISDLLRYSLANNNDLFVPLKQEMDAIRNYTDIEKIRYENKLVVDFQLDESSLDFRIPAFIVHPLVENAIKYGMETSEMPLKVEIRSEKVSNRLMVSITNTGKWILEGSKTKGTNTGLKNICERLDFQYPNRHILEIEKGENRVKVWLEITEPSS